MKFIEAMKDSDIRLAGIRAEIDWKGTQHKEVTLRDAEGNVVKITGAYGIDVLVPAPPAMVTKHRVAGRIPGIAEDVLEYHDTEHEANQTIRGIENALPGLRHALTVEKVEATEDEVEAHPPRLYQAKAAVEAPV